LLRCIAEIGDAVIGAGRDAQFRLLVANVGIRPDAEVAAHRHDHAIVLRHVAERAQVREGLALGEPLALHCRGDEIFGHDQRDVDLAAPHRLDVVERTAPGPDADLRVRPGEFVELERQASQGAMQVCPAPVALPVHRDRAIELRRRYALCGRFEFSLHGGRPLSSAMLGA
jgi:hypothetical protein